MIIKGTIKVKFVNGIPIINIIPNDARRPNKTVTTAPSPKIRQLERT